MSKSVLIGGLVPGAIVALTGIAVLYSIQAMVLVIFGAVALVGLAVAIWSLIDTRKKYR